MLLILRQDGAASAWRAAGVRACRAAAHLEEQEVAAGRAEVHAGLVRWRRNLRWGHIYCLWMPDFTLGRAFRCPVGALSPRGSAGKDVSSQAPAKSTTSIEGHLLEYSQCPWMLRARSQ